MLYDHVHRGQCCPPWLELVTLLSVLACIFVPRGELMAETQQPVRGPEFPTGMQWLNTDKLLRLADLGKIYAHTASNHLFVADSNHNRIVIADLAGNVLDVAGSGTDGTSFGLEDVINVATQQVRAGKAGRLTIDLKLPEGYHLNPRAPLRYRVRLIGTGIDIAEPDRQVTTKAPPLPLVIPFQAAEGRHQATVDIDLTFFYCREDNTGVCAIQSVRWLIPLRTAPDGSAADPVVSYKAAAPVMHKQL